MLTTLVDNCYLAVSTADRKFLTYTEGIGASRSIDTGFDVLIEIYRVVLEVVTDEGIDLLQHGQRLVAGGDDVFAVVAFRLLLFPLLMILVVDGLYIAPRGES